jgi:hypothetical protein
MHLLYITLYLCRRFKQRCTAATMLRDYILTLQYDYMKPDKIRSFYDRYKEGVLINGLLVDLRGLIGESCNDVMEFSIQFPKLFTVNYPKDPDLADPDLADPDLADPDLAHLCSISAKPLLIAPVLFQDIHSCQFPSLTASLSPASSSLTLGNSGSSSEKVDDDEVKEGKTVTGENVDDKVNEDKAHWYKDFSCDKVDQNIMVDDNDESSDRSNDKCITSSSGNYERNTCSSTGTKIEGIIYNNKTDNSNNDVDDISVRIPQGSCDNVPLRSDETINDSITDLATVTFQKTDEIVENDNKSSIVTDTVDIIESSQDSEMDYYVTPIINEQISPIVDTNISTGNDSKSIDSYTHIQEIQRNILSVSPTPIPPHSANNNEEISDAKEKFNERSNGKKDDISQSLSIGSSQSNMNMDLLMCPICLEIMVEPMLTPYGDSFEKSAILDWLQRNDTCPLTRRPLSVHVS